MGHVLVIDDDDILQDLLRFALELEGHAVTVCSDGRAALTYLAGARPDLMIVDLHMPVMDGVAFLEEARKTLDKMPPSLVLSASAETAYRDRLLALGVHAVLKKPMDTEGLTRCVAEALRTAPSKGPG